MFVKNYEIEFCPNEAGYNPVDLNTDAVLVNFYVDGKIISIEQVNL